MINTVLVIFNCPPQDSLSFVHTSPKMEAVHRRPTNGSFLNLVAKIVRYAATSLVGALMAMTSVVWVALRNEATISVRLCWL